MISSILTTLHVIEGHTINNTLKNRKPSERFLQQQFLEFFSIYEK